MGHECSAQNDHEDDVTTTDKIVLSTMSVGYRTPQQIHEQTGLSIASIVASLEAMQQRAHLVSQRRPLRPACCVRRGVDSPDIRDQLLYPDSFHVRGVQ